MNIVDSSGWLEYFADGPNANFFTPVIENISNLIISSINIYEVFKRVFQQCDENDAIQSIAIMKQGLVVDLNPMIAISAAKISVELKLPMADSIILATARVYNATLWTQDSDFKSIEGVQYIEKR
ncbi:VapC toxin family PIN domain ribonuclease [Candidatus Desantisbacteria bacterium CG2_30_40_21]|uniref:VapC toxin family PIN domain ribonuclease n=4 Tax=unclassified Candidatus Desantisiibacteriota TaxID=3106372 RepID=A0A2M7P3N5_9BACT|nr:MAG: VapC toxin family PIN domain ribonuclease [Candidatus Desantisbacteria bacterium CG2_30_40_21]PIP40857.1 MAG: VapC toxin family PIN domain ribonuclease [Candidatus Desantisbacteria bacterium CG23_combo_of_CG06-09_8_20_14_all_40_23]PIY19888.1 MAG: VapC toxin family PIN domain ribonuclease [Candidatus Desantisbacteria bacterium CG_4_10_14_3_um_filter_40_18]PJB29825.1 MAG: VapC toxin family PIN domain ribonuclease [Candidatus Desantisbacteria bacterium CG_4_9_14_3_um_filter_40_11]